MESVKSSARLTAVHNSNKVPATKETLRFNFIMVLLGPDARGLLLIRSARFALRRIVGRTRPHGWRRDRTGCGTQPQYFLAGAAEGHELRRRRGLLGGEEQADAPEEPAGARAAGPYSKRNAREEPRQYGSQPPEKLRREIQHRRAPGDTQGEVPLLPAERFSEGQTALVTLLCIPGNRAAEQGLHHEGRMEEHHGRREQHAEELLAEQAQAQRHAAA